MALTREEMVLDALSSRVWRASFERAYPAPVHPSKEGTREQRKANSEAFHAVWMAVAKANFNPQYTRPEFYPIKNCINHNSWNTRYKEWSLWRDEMESRVAVCYWKDPMAAMGLIDTGVVEVWEQM